MYNFLKCIRYVRVNVLILLAIFASVDSYAGDDSEKNKLISTLNIMRSFSADFKQVTIAKKRDKKIEKGVVAMQRPNHFLWRIIQPFRQDIIATKNKLWMIDKELEQVVIQSTICQSKSEIKKECGSAPPFKLLTGDAQIFLRDYDVKYHKNREDEIYRLTPKDVEESLFKHVEITFNKQVLNKVVLSDSFDKKIQIYFTQVKVNKSIKLNMFDTSIPKRYDIFDQTKAH